VIPIGRNPGGPMVLQKDKDLALQQIGDAQQGIKDFDRIMHGEAPLRRPRHDDPREKARRANLHECVNICLFFIYLLFFSVAMLLEQSAMSSRFADHLRQILDGGAFPLKDVANVDQMYTFMQSTLVPALYQNNTDTNLAIDSSRYLHPIDSSNRMMGVARIRQARVKLASDCQESPMFSNYQIPCYPSYNSGTASRDAFGPDGVFGHLTDPDGSSYTGYMASYDGDGFMEFLSTNRTAAEITLVDLKDNGFLDIATRAVFIDFTVWNSNVGSYAVMRICSEFSPSGTAAHFVEVAIVSQGMLAPGGLGESKDWAAFVFMLIVMCFVIWYICEEAFELYEKGIGYFWDGWNVMDWINMIILIIAFILRCVIWAQASSTPIGAAQIAQANSYSSIRGIAGNAELVKYLYAINAVLLWAKCAKYFRHLPIVRVLIRTVWDSFKLFLPFLSMFSIVLIGFTLAYKIGFGDKIRELTSFTQAIIFLSRAFLRDVSLMPVYYLTPIFGAMLILLFYIMMILVGMNVLLATVADALYSSKQSRKDDQKENELHEDEPFEEFMRECRKACAWICIKCLCGGFYRKIMRQFAKELVEELEVAKTQLETEQGLKALGNGSGKGLQAIGMGQAGSENGSVVQEPEKIITSEMLMRAIEHMSGRVLSEVQEVGIEIRSELHDVCERVAQMQMAVQELEWRAELVRREQTEVI